MEKPRYRPLHVQIRDVLHERIASGEWSPGELIPSEIALAAEFEASTGTIRKALDDLAASHLLVRHRGRGTFVASHSLHEALFRWFSIELDKGTARRFPRDLVVRQETGPARADERRDLVLPARATVIRLFRHRFLKDEIMMHDQLVLPAELFHDFAWPKAAAQFATPYEYYERHHGVKVLEITERVSAVAATPFDAGVLGVPEGTPLLAIRRVALTFDGQPVELRMSRVRSQGYAYVNRIA